MQLIPDDELKKSMSINLAPMVDFLFLVVAVFATLAVTRTALFDTEVDLVKVRQQKQGASDMAYNDSYTINLSVTESGRYKWITEFNEYYMENLQAIKDELMKQEQAGILPGEKGKIKILLHIDKKAQWEPIAQAIFEVKKSGYTINPVYELDD